MHSEHQVEDTIVVIVTKQVLVEAGIVQTKDMNVKEAMTQQQKQQMDVDQMNLHINMVGVQNIGKKEI